MTNDDKITDGKLQYGINREAEKLLALSSGKIDKYEYLISEVILPCNQERVIEQAKFIYSPFEKQIKTTEDQGEKQVKALESRGKKFFEELTNKWMEEIQDLSKQIDLGNINFRYNGNTAPKTRKRIENNKS